MLGGEPEAARRSLLGVELDEDGVLVADDPGVVPGLDRHDLRGDELERAAVPVLALDVSASEEPDVRVHAALAPDGRAHVGRPAEPGRVDGPLHAAVPDPDDLDDDAADLAAIGALDRLGERIHGAYRSSSRRYWVSVATRR